MMTSSQVVREFVVEVTDGKVNLAFVTDEGEIARAAMEPVAARQVADSLLSAAAHAMVHGRATPPHGEASDA